VVSKERDSEAPRPDLLARLPGRETTESLSAVSDKRFYLLVYFPSNNCIRLGWERAVLVGRG
jgi:hypothetical protein